MNVSRYDIHRAYVAAVWALGRPFRTIEIKLWDWCHYQHGSGKHLDLPLYTWRKAWSSAKEHDV